MSEAERSTVFDATALCRRRVLALEKGIAQFLAAHDDSEMSNEQAAIEHLRRLLERI